MATLTIKCDWWPWPGDFCCVATYTSAMRLQLYGHKTETIFTQIDAETLDRGHYTALKTHTHPTYFWGNYLVYHRPPALGDYAQWIPDFAREFTDPRTYHRAFSWNTLDLGDISEFEKNGFSLEKNLTLTAKVADIQPPKKSHPSLYVSSPTTDAEWEEVILVQAASAYDGHIMVSPQKLFEHNATSTNPPPSLSLEQWEHFYRHQILRYKKFIARQVGQWFCAKIENKIVGSLGIFIGPPQNSDASTTPPGQEIACKN